jgi:hypothetical protein
MVVELTYEPRQLQATIHAAMDRHRFGAVVCHRRFGKTVLAINHLQVAALECQRERPRFGFLAPFREQAKSIAWDYLTHYSQPIPGVEQRISELAVNYPNGGQVRLFGADNPDALRGLYFDGLVLDEYGLMPPRIFTEVLRPTLSDRRGWALFLGTPAGKNQFYDVVRDAQTRQAAGDPDWFYASYKASETGILAVDELEAARRDMSPDEYAQEYECSFEAAIKGAIYVRELEAARAAGRMTSVPIEPVLPVDTTWDLGVGDSTAIWFTQSVRSGEVRVVDYYESSGEGLPHYAQVLRQKGYTYGQHVAPPDIQVREFASGRSRLEAAASLGLSFSICAKVPLEDGIHAARMLMPRCWFDATRCRAGLEALAHYRRDYNRRLNEFKPAPVHDWASHGADAFRYFAVWQKTPEPTEPPPDDSGIESEFGSFL